MPMVPLLLAQRERERLLASHHPHGEDADIPAEPPENTKLFLPHQLALDQLEQCAVGLAEIEERLRDAQMDESLDKLHVQLHVKSQLLNFKNLNVCYQKHNTHMRSILDANEAKIKLFSAKYRAAWSAKRILAGNGEWQDRWRDPKPGDIRTMAKEDDLANRKAARYNAGLSEDSSDDDVEESDGASLGTSGVDDATRGLTDEAEDSALRHRRKPPAKKAHLSEGKRETSWIWFGAGTGNGDASSAPGMEDGESFHSHNYQNVKPLSWQHYERSSYDPAQGFCVTRKKFTWYKRRNGAHSSRWKKKPSNGKSKVAWHWVTSLSPLM